jgi:hypothetical protein
MLLQHAAPEIDDGLAVQLKDLGLRKQPRECQRQCVATRAEYDQLFDASLQRFLHAIGNPRLAVNDVRH